MNKKRDLLGILFSLSLHIFLGLLSITFGIIHLPSKPAHEPKKQDQKKDLQQKQNRCEFMFLEPSQAQPAKPTTLLPKPLQANNVAKQQPTGPKEQEEIVAHNNNTPKQEQPEKQKPIPLTKEQKQQLALKSLLKSQKNETTAEAEPPSTPTTMQNLYHAIKHEASEVVQTEKSNTLSTHAKVCAVATSMKEFSYQQKIINHLVSAYATVKQKKTYIPKGVHKSAGINLEINADGTIALASIAESSGDTDFDALILQSIAYAAPFPTIPKHLGITRFKLTGGTIWVS